MSLGFVDTSNRKVRPISELGKMVNFGTLERTDPIVNPDGTVPQTVEYMKKIVREHHQEMSKIADSLWDNRLSRFLRNTFDFVMTYVKYEKDSAFMEQLRTPLRTLSDQRGDCDCMSVLIGSILYHKNIPFYFRVAKYDANNDFSHVYVVVPKKDSEGYYVVDPVIKNFDMEKTFVDHKDYLMDSRLSGFNGLDGLPIQMLNGATRMSGIDLMGGYYGLYGNLMAVAMGSDLSGFGLGSAENDETAMYNYLVRTRDVILAAPGMFKIMKNPLEVARMLDYAIRYWNTELRDHALGVLENEEQRLLREGVIVYPHADLTGDELGDLGKGFFKKVGAAVKKGAQAVGKGVATAAKATGKAVATAAKATGKAVATAAKAAGNFVLRFNPVSLAARGGMLMAIRLNLFKLADKLQYGLYTDEQAKAAGLNMDSFKANQDAYNQARKLFCNTLKGNEGKFKKAIEKGVKHKAVNVVLNGLGQYSDEAKMRFRRFKRRGYADTDNISGLGELAALGVEPATASIVTAAMSFIAKVLSLFKGKKNPATGQQYLDENPTESDFLNIMDYDEDGNPVYSAATTANPEPASQSFLDKAGNLLNTAYNTATALVPGLLPSSASAGGGSSDSGYEYENEYEPTNIESMPTTIVPATATSSAVTANVMTGGAMSNIGNFIKKNAVMLGVGAAALAGGIYLLTRKKKSRGLSGVSRTRAVSRQRPPSRKRITRKSNTPKRLKALRLK